MSSEKDLPQNRAGAVACPFCDATDNELFSLFGQSLIGSQYYCNNCYTVFEAERWGDPQSNEEDTDTNEI